jgi:hypothetical protein
MIALGPARVVDIRSNTPRDVQVKHAAYFRGDRR